MMDTDSSLQDRIQAAATLLIANPALENASGNEVDLLHIFAYDDRDIAAAPARARLLRAAARLRRLFLLPVPDAPGLVFFGAEADPAAIDGTLAGMPVGSMAGSGLTPQRAFESCVGEAVEYLSQFVRAADPLQRGTFQALAPDDPPARRFLEDLLRACRIAPTQPVSWVPVRALGSGTEAWLPADLCLRRPPAQQDMVPPLKLSTGCAAGATRDDAALRAMLELIERDAVALWWRGGRRGRGIRPDSSAGRAAAELLDALRQGQDARQTWLLDITTDLAVPAVAALSCNPDGYGFAFGFGARLSLADAACAALHELCQVELGVHVVAAKRQESGDAALRDGDLRHLQRSTLVDAHRCALLQPEGESAPPTPDFDPHPAAALRQVCNRLAAAGAPAFLLDLTRPDFDVPVVRIVAPGLQPEPCAIPTPRLTRTIHATGGALQHTGGLSLL